MLLHIFVRSHSAWALPFLQLDGRHVAWSTAPAEKPLPQPHFPPSESHVVLAAGAFYPGVAQMMFHQERHWLSKKRIHRCQNIWKRQQMWRKIFFCLVEPILTNWLYQGKKVWIGYVAQRNFRVVILIHCKWQILEAPMSDIKYCHPHGLVCGLGGTIIWRCCHFSDRTFHIDRQKSFFWKNGRNIEVLLPGYPTCGILKVEFCQVLTGFHFSCQTGKKG